MPQISFDSRAILIDQQRILLLSGSIHYPRSTPEMWPHLFQKLRAAGLNTVETYAFWNLHEKQQGHIDFSGRLDLAHFCRLAQQHGLHVFLRIGPYICAETNFGGFPPWLRDVPNIQMRTDNQPFKAAMTAWVTRLCDYLRPLFAPSGGPIILAGIENEYGNISHHYGAAGIRYLEYCRDLANSLHLGIPLTMCNGDVPGALTTHNALWGHGKLDEHYAKHPDQPVLWTENWPGWYDTYGYARHLRSTTDMTYLLARFFAGGGTGANYYMFHGGTNFDRVSMYLQTATYDFDAPLDEYGLETTKYHALAKLHHLLAEHAPELLAQNPPAPLTLGEKQLAFTYAPSSPNPLTFLCNDEESAPAHITFAGESYDLAPYSVQILSGSRLLLDTAQLDPAHIITRHMEPLATLPPFEASPEPLPAHRSAGLAAPEPLEQLRLTQDRSDYCWYSSTFTSTAPTTTLTLDGVADFVSVYVDGQLHATTATPLVENRTLQDHKDFTQTFTLRLPPGHHRLDLLCCALGLIKGDWMLGFKNMAEERKGLFGRALIDDQPLSNWTMHPMLQGELTPPSSWTHFDPHNPSPWSPLWLRTTFPRPDTPHPLALDLLGQTKGLIFINGRCLSRYWLLTATIANPISPFPPMTPAGLGEPTQRYYHLPQSFLAPHNTLTLFSELPTPAPTIQLCRRI